jgi:tetratricopeptide (TPR) repeat protein
MKWLDTARNAWRGRSDSELPETLRQRLADRSFGAIQDEVQRLMTANPDADGLKGLRAEVERYDWSALEVEKLEAYGHFYRGDLGRAFSRAIRYCGAADGNAFDVDLFILAVLCLFHNHQYENAYRLLSSIDESESRLAEHTIYLNIKSSICLACDQLDEARISLDQARRLAPDDPLTAFNACALYFELGNQPIFDQLRTDIAGGRYGNDGKDFALATCDLARNRYAPGFDLLECRYNEQDAVRFVNPSLPANLRWRQRGLDLPTDERLLVTCEQGLGDSIMMARYLPLMWEHLQEQLVMEVQPEALTLLQHNFPAIPMVPREHGKLPPLTFERWIGSMSLPYLFGSEPGNIPGTTGYLTVTPDNRDYWSQRVRELAPSDSPRIGLAWSGNPAHRRDRCRSIPFELVSRFLQSQRDSSLFALQTVIPTHHPAALIDISEELITLADTAALIAELDLVITVDTSIVHLAGALGRPTWLLLPYRYEWRWGLEGERNNWYDSVSVLRQTTRGDWEGLLTDVMGRRLPDFLDTSDKQSD